MECNNTTLLDTFWGQLIALVTFFSFPAIQYVILKNFSKNEGRPELWYLPAYGFRLVIRNIPRRKVLSDIKSRTTLRQVIPSGIGSSVDTFQDIMVKEVEDFFLLPGNDLILISFKIEKNENGLTFIQTNKLGEKLLEKDIEEFEELTACYTANIENYLNFDIKIAKQITIGADDLRFCWETVQDSKEQRLTCGYIIDIG